MLDHDIVDLFAHGDRDVARQGPGRGRPDEQVDTRLILQGELDEDAWVFCPLLITQCQLVAAEGGSAARAVGHDLVTLVDQATIPELLENPPQGLDIIIGQGAIRGGQIDPIPHALCELLPVIHIVEDALAAEPVEFSDAIVLDSLLAGEAQFFLHFELDRETVGVPAALARHVVAAHGPVARKDVLEGPRQDVVDSGAAVRRGRPLIKHIARPVSSLLHRLLEDVCLFPECQNIFFHLRQVYLRRDVFEFRHDSSTFNRSPGSPRQPGGQTLLACLGSELRRCASGVNEICNRCGFGTAGRSPGPSAPRSTAM